MSLSEHGRVKVNIKLQTDEIIYFKDPALFSCPLKCSFMEQMQMFTLHSDV